MSADSNISQQPWIQRNVLWLAGTFFLGSLALYFLSFNGPLSDRQGTWGEFGDYMGGVVNPIIGLCTIWLLTVSLRQNQVALQQAREELTLARLALESSHEIQGKTELALQQQIEIADQTRDMANAVALWSHLRGKGNELTAQIKLEPGNTQKSIQIREKLNNQLNAVHNEACAIDAILNFEVSRLLKKYSGK